MYNSYRLVQVDVGVKQAADVAVLAPEEAAGLEDDLAGGDRFGGEVAEEEAVEDFGEPAGEPYRDLDFSAEVGTAAALKEGLLQLVGDVGVGGGTRAGVDEDERAALERCLAQVGLLDVVGRVFRLAKTRRGLPAVRQRRNGRSSRAREWASAGAC